MGLKKHPFGCICKTHIERPWNRPEHWTLDEINYLEGAYGRYPDETIARHLGRTVVGINLKAKRLGLHKRTQGLTARRVAEIFGVDPSIVAKLWIVKHGVLPAMRLGKSYEHGNSPRRIRERGLPPTSASRYSRPTYWLVEYGAIDTFIRDHPEYIDVEKMPPSWYRDLAAGDPWISLPEVRRRTGRDPHKVALLIRAGLIRGRRRGTHWYVPTSEVAKIRPLRSQDAIDESVFRRESLLEIRRNRRKGVAA